MLVLQVRERERKAWAQDMARVEQERWDLCEKLELDRTKFTALLLVSSNRVVTFVVETRLINTLTDISL